MTYAFVNQTTKNGITYTAYRSTSDPTDCYIESEGKKRKVKDLKTEWSKL